MMRKLLHIILVGSMVLAGAGMISAAVGCLMLLTQSEAAEQKTLPAKQPSIESAEQGEQPDAKPADQPMTALARVSRILGLLKHDTQQDVDPQTLTTILDGFALLGQLRPDDSQEMKARLYLAALREWNTTNLEKIEEAKAKAKVRATLDLGQDAP